MEFMFKEFQGRQLGEIFCYPDPTRPQLEQFDMFL